MSVKLPINVVARRTGLSPHVIRVWEKRYRAVTPERTSGKQRSYSEADVERLALLAKLTARGHQIGAIASLPGDELQELLRRERGEAEVQDESPEETLIREALQCAGELDRRGLDEILRKGALKFGGHGLLERVIGPLAERVGELWRDGTLTAAHEHFFTSAIRDFLALNTRPYALDGAAPGLIVTTPAGQLHELGAVIVATAARDLGWHVIYLGPSLPPAEIAVAAVQNKARAVALSIVYPEDDANLPAELRALRRYLPESISILAGGRAAPAYAQTLNEIGARQPVSLSRLYEELNELRRNSNQKIATQEKS